jgi:two-component system NarL family sensor kinase
LFAALGVRFDLDRDDAAYALLVLPVYAVLIALNLLLLAGLRPDLAASDRARVLRESAVPALPFELVSGLLAAGAVLAWSQVGPAAAVGLLLAAQLLTVTLTRTLSEAMRSDERASEVERLSLDRDRLLTEVLQAESRERARLAESLHDGPMQRLSALRQDAVEEHRDTTRIDEAIDETRAIISAFHPATVRELGFEASLRAAVAPFSAARTISLTVRISADDAAVAGSLLLPIAQELVVNAVKHAGPTEIAVVVSKQDERLTLEVDDDGVGIDTAKVGHAVQAGHLGLAMVRRRVEDAGGTLHITTREDGGTRSRVTLPETRMAPG